MQKVSQIQHGAIDCKPSMSKCHQCQIVRGAKLSVFTHGAKLSGAKLSALPNCLRCKIVRSANFSWCQIVRGAKLSWCQIVRQHGRCHIVRGAKLSR